MLKNRDSKLKLYSLGIVTQNKKRGSNEITVFPVEELPLTEGLIDPIRVPHLTSLPDVKDINRTTLVVGKVTITAKWFPHGHSNRVTAPDVIKNETVAIYRYADTDDYYWTTIFNEPSIRRLETVRYAYGNVEADLIEYDENSSYWAEVSTHDKYIKIHTSKNDDEFCTYDILVNTLEGYIEINDDLGNRIRFSSPSGQIAVEATRDIILKAPNIHLDGNVGIKGTCDVKENITAPWFVGAATTAAVAESKGGASPGNPDVDIPEIG